MQCPTCGQPCQTPDLRVDLSGFAARGDRVVKLTHQQAEILDTIVKAAPNTARYGRIFAAVYGLQEEPGDAMNVLRAQVARMKAPLAILGLKLQSVYGEGYRIVETDAAEAAA